MTVDNSLSKMRHFDNSRAIARRVINKTDSETISQTADTSTAASIKPEYKSYSSKRYSAEIPPKNLIKALGFSRIVSRRTRDPSSSLGYCIGKGVSAASLLISVFAVWSVWSSFVISYRLTKTTLKPRIGGSAVVWLDEFSPNLVVLHLPVTHRVTMTQGTLSKIRIPNKLKGKEKKGAKKRDFGGLSINPLPRPDPIRRIKDDRRLTMTEFREADAPRDDDVEYFYVADDDYSRIHYGDDDDDGDGDGDGKRDAHGDGEEEENGCRYVSDYHLNFQNCNSFHEIPLVQSDLKFLGEGDYRAAATISHQFGQESEAIVYKHIHYNEQVTRENFEYMRLDALVAERLTASPHIYNVYGLCGIATFSELLSHGDVYEEAIGDDDTNIKRNRPSEHWPPNNELTGVEKLEISLSMAEALADLHGSSSGVIVHQDTKMDQFFWADSEQSSLKLNDFNRAVFMLWDEEKQEYCRFYEDEYRKWRSPEESRNADDMNEKVDVFGLSRMMYVLLTGHWYTKGERYAKARKGGPLFIDPRYKKRSSEEAKLAAILEMCQEYNADDRPSIFEVIRLLKEALADVKPHRQDH